MVGVVTGWAGFGQMMFRAVGTRDYPLVQSCLLVFNQLAVWLDHSG